MNEVFLKEVIEDNIKRLNRATRKIDSKNFIMNLERLCEIIEEEGIIHKNKINVGVEK